MMDAGRHPNITLLTYSEVEEISGYVGNFNVRIRKRARSIDEDKCTGCGTCEENCAYNAITVDEERGVATVNSVLCKGCGTCATVCPSGAAVSPKFEKGQIIDMIEDALLPARGGA
jgi:heterodisulfide reductase subunit A